MRRRHPNFDMSAKATVEQVVNPWEAHAGAGQSTINYDKLIGKLSEIIIIIIVSRLLQYR